MSAADAGSLVSACRAVLDRQEKLAAARVAADRELLDAYERARAEVAERDGPRPIGMDGEDFDSWVNDAYMTAAAFEVAVEILARGLGIDTREVPR